MLFRLSRVSFWLAAAVAALALLAPGGHETLLMAVTVVACALAYFLWRSGIAAQRRDHGAQLVVPEAPVLNETALLDAAATLVRRAHAAPSFEAALHAVAQVLRGELGARVVLVHEVREVGVEHAWIAELIEAQPGFHAVARRLRLDGQPLAAAIVSRREAGRPPGSVVVPVLMGGRVGAAIELVGIALQIAPSALAGLLELARLTLSNRAPDAAAAATIEPRPRSLPEPVRLRGDVLVVEDNVVIPELTTRLLRRLGCRVTTASGMLDARNALGRTQFDLVLVDLQLAGAGTGRGGHGPRPLASGKLGGAAAGTAPMIAIVGAGWPADAQRLRELGFDDHVCKPFRHDQMLALLSKYLRPRAPAETTPSGGGAAPSPAPAPSASAPASDAVLDPAALARLMELDPTGANQLLERVLKAFQTSAARLRPQAEAARGGGDPAGLRLVAHTLKSSSASIGALHLSQVCAQIEASIRNGDGDDLATQIDTLDTALDAVLGAIDQLLKERA